MDDTALMAEWLRLAGYAVFDGWQTEVDIAASFETDPANVQGVIIALYGHPSYEGWAYVLMVKEGKLFEATGSHCSCYGLEGQWEEEETSVAAIRKREWSDEGLLTGTSARVLALLDVLESMGVTG